MDATPCEHGTDVWQWQTVTQDGMHISYTACIFYWVDSMSAVALYCFCHRGFGCERTTAVYNFTAMYARKAFVFYPGLWRLVRGICDNEVAN